MSLSYLLSILLLYSSFYTLHIPYSFYNYCSMSLAYLLSILLLYSCFYTLHIPYSFYNLLFFMFYYIFFHILLYFYILSILFICSSFMPVNTNEVDTGLYVPGGTIINAQDNDVYGRPKRGRYVSTQTGPLCVDPNGASILTQTGPLYYMLQTYSLNGMPIYPSTWSDTGNQCYYFFLYISQIHG